MTPYDNRCEDCGSFAPADGGPCKSCRRFATDRDGRLQPCAREGCDERHDNAKYCSKRCMWDANKKREDERVCAGCGEVFEVPPRSPDQKHCTRACYHDHRNAGVEVDVSSSRENYFIADNQVVFSVDNKLLRIPVNRWDAICADYSSYGGDLTRAEVARKHGIPIPLMKRVLTAYEQYKASPPMMRERVAEAEDLQPLVQEAVEHVEHELLNRIERQRLNKIEREWRELRTRLRDESRHTEAAREIVDGLTIHVPKSDHSRPSRDGIVAHVPTADVHVGLYVWGEEGFGDNYDTDIACERLIAHGRQAAGWLAEKGGASVVYRSDLGDFFHADEKGETARGTFVDLDTRLGRVWSMGLDALIENIVTVHTEAERTVVKLQQGNHDAPDTVKLKHSVAMALRDVDGIEVDVSPHPYASFRVGDTQHILDHGYHVSKRLAWKATAQAESVARSFWEDFQAARFHYTWMGHLHSRAVGGELDHHEIVRLEALCEANDYETELRYTSRPAARLYELDERGRERDSRVLRTEDLDGRSVDDEAA